MSPREQAQNEIAEWLENHTGRFTAPYGVIAGTRDLPKGGKVREVVFGVARYLDASVTIWSPTKIQVRGQGALESKVHGDFNSVKSVIEHLEKV
jgi:hypothetical protein